VAPVPLPGFPAEQKFINPAYSFHVFFAFLFVLLVQFVRLAIKTLRVY